MREILFICEHNSARSQMAAAYLNYCAADRLHAESAGLEPGALNPYVVDVPNLRDLPLFGHVEKMVIAGVDLRGIGPSY